MPVLTVVQPDADVTLDRFADWLDGLELRIVRAYAGEEAGPVDELDGLLVLGGRMSALDDHLPGIAATRALLADAVAAGVPTLGICLGAQLLAVATGGQVLVAAPPGVEGGIVDVRWRPEAAQDALVGGLVSANPGHRRGAAMPSMHGDAVVDLPRGAVWLGASPMYPYQAFRLGSAWGLQFHPETSPATMHRWAEDDETVDTATVDAAFAEQDAEIAVAGRAIAQAFAAAVTARTSGAASTA